MGLGSYTNPVTALSSVLTSSVPCAPVRPTLIIHTMIIMTAIEASVRSFYSVCQSFFSSPLLSPFSFVSPLYNARYINRFTFLLLSSLQP